MRATLADIKTSRIPELVGICRDDTARLAAIVNDAQQRLIFAGRETGWWQGWVRVRFAITTAHPYITLPREFARVINMAIGRFPIYIHNDFYEVLPGGPGVKPDPNALDWCGQVQGYERGVWPTTIDLTQTNQKLRLYYTDTRDAGTKILFVGLDEFNNQIYSQDGLNAVNGFYLTLAAPFIDSTFIVKQIQGVVKPMTFGDVLLYQVDATTGAQVLLSRYKASETNPAYRRYFFHPTVCQSVIGSLPPDPSYTTTMGPNRCCLPGQSPCFNVNAICKQEYIPAVRDTDFLIIGNIPALEEMIQALRFYSQDVTASHQMAQAHEKRALRLLAQELDHYEGIENPAVVVDLGIGRGLRRFGFGRRM